MEGGKHRDIHNINNEVHTIDVRQDEKKQWCLLATTIQYNMSINFQRELHTSVLNSSI